MKMYKTFILLGFTLGTLVLAQCGPAKGKQNTSMELQEPSFATSKAHFNTYVAGVQGGGSGIEFYIELEELPADVVLEKVHFGESAGKLMRGTGHYVARFRTDQGKDQDVVMSSDPNEEAVNTPPVQVEQFPFPLEKDEAGITYRKKGVLLYTKIIDVQEREGIAYPSVRPRDGGQ